MTDIGGLVQIARTSLQLDPATVAEAVRIDTQALLRYEASEVDIPGDVLWRISDVLGVPLEELPSLPSEQEVAPYLKAMSVRFKSESKVVPPSLRLAVTRAAGAALDFVTLEQIADLPSRYDELLRRFPNRPSIPFHVRVWEAGQPLAKMVRDTIQLDGPIPSVLRMAREQLGVLVIWQHLPSSIAGYALCDATHGPTMILNVNGRNVNELVRRFTQAHELCHILFEKDNLQQLSTFDNYEDFTEQAREPFEVRANAFAIHLLAPQQDFQKEWHTRPDIRHMMERFGLNYEAVRRHLDSMNLLPVGARASGVPIDAPDEWKVAESLVLWYPAFDIIPIERRYLRRRIGLLAVARRSAHLEPPS